MIFTVILYLIFVGVVSLLDVYYLGSGGLPVTMYLKHCFLVAVIFLVTSRYNRRKMPQASGLRHF